MSARVFVLAVPNKKNPDAIKEYTEGVGPLVKESGASIAFRGKFVEGIAGSDFPATVLLLDFESKEAAVAFFEGANYQSLIPTRDRAFTKMEIFITE